ncbi:MraY family glycosyltransferase [uncultured Sunxiuqinia sp.]|uniref:glycosyltransferase family 4 protein n=1 Tax=uncultured Sunxiuqinia sp. TaxID=1573825 RepID=UPI002AA773FC|nr:MraY family glycosyltransferase [uncultured Sunxiuqinia sp.]
MEQYLFYIFCTIIISFLITYVCIPPIVRISQEKKLFDVPNSRKLNKTVIPTLGGVSIFIGITLSSILFIGQIEFPEFRYILAALILLFFIGLKDDILIIAPMKKLLIQVLAAGILVFMGNVQISSLSNLFYLNQISIWMSAPISFMLLLFLINAINLIDGIDGLAASITMLVSSILGVCFLITGHFAYTILSFAVAGSLLAFLRFNLWGKENKIFMGDTGSLILGCLLGILAIKFLSFNVTAPEMVKIHNAPNFILSLLIVPVTDTLRVFAIRLYQKRSPFSADMNHIHHILIRSGMQHIQASVFLILYTLFFVSLSISSQAYLSTTFSFLLTLAISFAVIGYLHRRSEKIMKKRSKQIQLTRRVLSTGIPVHQDPFKFIRSKKRLA